MKSNLLGIATAGRTVLGAVVGMVIGIVPEQADAFFPIVNPGDAFAGQISIDPTTPPNSGGDPLLHQYVSPSIGVFTVNIGGATFSEPVTLIQSVVFTPGVTWEYSWSAQQEPFPGDTLSFNGTPLSFGFTFLRFFGSTTSTGAILPESLSSYTSSEMRIIAPGAQYFGILTSLVPTDVQGDFNFTGTISSASFPPVGVPGRPRISEPASWGH